MDKFDQQGERLLEQERDGGEFEKDNHTKHRFHTGGKGTRQYVPAVVLCLLVISLVWNIVLVGSMTTLGKQQRDYKSDFAGLEQDALVPFAMYTEFMNLNRSISDPLWTAQDSHSAMIALDHEYVNKHGLGPSAPCPQDQSKQIYQVKSLHHIHCLKSIRMAYFDSLEASPDSEPEVPPQHVAHCLDVLRQDILCTGDDTPTPIHQHGHGQEDKKGEMRKCKDWGKLVEWTQGEERGSCFSMSGH